jgi:hypothetical protein
LGKPSAAETPAPFSYTAAIVPPSHPASQFCGHLNMNPDFANDGMDYFLVFGAK